MRFMMLQRTLPFMVAAALLATAPPAAAEDPETPLPPANVEASWTGNGTKLDWDPPFVGEADLTGYKVYQLVNGSRHLVDTVAANVTEYLAAGNNQGDLFWVTSTTSSSESVPSAPTTAYPHCGVIYLFPLDVQPECLFPLPILDCEDLQQAEVEKACALVWIRS